MDKIESIELIYRNPKIRRGMPCIVGTTLRVLDLAMAMIFAQRTVDELAADYDLPMAKVHAALAYYYCNKEEIDRGIREDIRRSEELMNEGAGKRPDSIFPLNLTEPQLDEALMKLAREEAAAAERGEPITYARKRIIVRDYLASIPTRGKLAPVG